MTSSITAAIPLGKPPTWAVLERALIELMAQAVHPFLEKYTDENHEIIYRDDWVQGRDGADDFYEAFYNWPLLYLLGGDDNLLMLGQRQWEATTRQLTRLGLLHKEYEIGYDHFHQGESYIYFYFLCLADPAHELNRERARRFAGFYLNEDPDAPNYDPEQNIVRAPHNGSLGPRPGVFDRKSQQFWTEGMRPYGLPYTDVPGVSVYDDLQDPELGQRMLDAMEARMSKGDAISNLPVTSLVANAYLLTGEEKYKSWTLNYIAGWAARAQANGGLAPDNVGLSGEVGETLGGRWYGALYGWSWPHGFHSVANAVQVAVTNAVLLNQKLDHLDFARDQLEPLWQMGKVCDIREHEMSLGGYWLQQMGMRGSYETFVIPNRIYDSGWFDYHPLDPGFLPGLWNLSMSDEDWARIERVRDAECHDWRVVYSFRNKSDSGHEPPWLRFLAGDNPTYPEEILQASLEQVQRRLDLIAADEVDLSQVHIHHWQLLNPVTTEALVQLTLGGPQHNYNGGLLMTRLRYFDLDRRRPGLPQDVAALVEKLSADEVTVTLVNLNAFDQRRMLLQAGAFAEHHFVAAHFDARVSDYPGKVGTAVAPPLATETKRVAIDDKYLTVIMPPATQVTLTMQMARFVNTPTYDFPAALDGSGMNAPAPHSSE